MCGVGIDYVPYIGLYQQTIRVWSVDRTHDAAQRSISRVCAIHRRGPHVCNIEEVRTRVARVAGTDCVPQIFVASHPRELRRLPRSRRDGNRQMS